MKQYLWWGILVAAWFAGCRGNEDLSMIKDEGPWLSYIDYDVRFTNPECREYRYDTPVRSNGGDLLYAKPKNVYCKPGDARTGYRSRSPQSKLLSWIEDEDTKEIWFHFLSFSNSTVQKALCSAVERGVRITFVLDDGTDLSAANRLMDCRPPLGGDRPVMHLRGGRGGIGYAHNKMLIVNPRDERMKIAFASANLSSGVVLHHENWHFVEIYADTFFAQAHRCLHEGVVEHGFSEREYAAFIQECRDDIPYEEERDIKVFLIPGEGDRATRYMTNAIDRSENISIAAHRFSYSTMIRALGDKLRQSDVSMRLIVDDDVYWASQGEQVGPNTRGEASRIDGLRRSGMDVAYMETNHDAHLLHHNKFLIFEDERGPDAVLTGAANLTQAGFHRNFENIYYIELPTVVSSFKQQYEYMWDELATSYEDLPVRNVTP